jgi:hypothetical protein
LTAADVAMGGAPREGDVRGSPTDPLARIVFALLVVACFAAFFITQRLKHTPTALQRFEGTRTFSPASGGEARQERISFKLSHAEAVTVTVIDAGEGTVATLLNDYPVPRYKQFSFRWNGHRGTARRYSRVTSASGHRSVIPDNEGALAPAGEYRVRVVLHGQGDRELLSPWSFTLVRG